MEDAAGAKQKILWTFFARIVPERQPISIPFPGMKVVSDNLGVSFDLSCRIHNSQIIAVLENVDFDANILTVRNLLKLKLNSYIDLIGFISGMHYDVDIISAASNDGSQYIFGTEIPILYNKNYSPTMVLDGDVVQSVLSNPVSEMMLSDYREAMRSPLLTGFFCYHAIEACMQSFKQSPSSADATAWETMREALGIAKDVILYIKNRADWARHARLGSISDEERARIFTYTEEIFNRYFAYVRAGYKSCAQPKLEL